MDRSPDGGNHPSSAQGSPRDTGDELMQPYASPISPAGMSLSQVLGRYGLVLLGLGLVYLVWFSLLGLGPVIAVWFVYVVAVESTALLAGIVAIIIGVGAMIAQIWADDHMSVGTRVHRKVVRHCLTVGGVCAIALAVLVVYPASATATLVFLLLALVYGGLGIRGPLRDHRASVLEHLEQLEDEEGMP